MLFKDLTGGKQTSTLHPNFFPKLRVLLYISRANNNPSFIYRTPFALQRVNLSVAAISMSDEL